MYELQHKINLIHYNIWRFERWTRYLVFGDRRITSIGNELGDHPAGKELDDCLPFAVGVVDEYSLPNYSGKHFSFLVSLLLFTALDFCCALLGLNVQVLFWGIIVSIIPTLIISNYLTPMPWKFIDGVPTRKNQLLEDFKIFESMSVSDKRKSGLITFLIVIGIWTASVLSFIYYLRASIAAKR